MSSGKYVFLYGYYGCGNYGDDLLLENIVGKIELAQPNSTLFVRNLDKISVKDTRIDLVPTNVERLLNISSGSAVIKLIAIIRYLLKISFYVLRSDFLILGGGTIFGDRQRTSMVVLFYLCLLSRIRGGKVMGIGLGVAPLNNWTSKWLVRKIVWMCCTFSVRDRQSLQRCRNIGCKGDVLLGADLVYLGKSHNPIQGKTYGRHIGVALLDPSNGWSGNDAKEELIRNMVVVCEKLLSEGWKITYFGFQLLKSGTERFASIDDLEIYKAIRSGIKPELYSRLSAISFSTSRVGAEEIFGTVDIVLGMRFHSLVLAALSGKPFVGIAHDDKVRELCNEYKMPVYTLKFSLQKILQDISNMANAKPDQAITAAIRGRAKKSCDALLYCLGEQD